MKKGGAVPLRELVKRSAGSSEMNNGGVKKAKKSAVDIEDDEWARIERQQLRKGSGGGAGGAGGGADGGNSTGASKKGKKKGKGKGGKKNQTEKQQSAKAGGAAGRGGGSNDDSDEWTSDDSDDETEVEGGGMSLDGNDKDGKLENFTFEFRDMLESFEEGITTLLKQLVANPTDAYNVAHIIAKQDIVGTAVLCEGGDDIFAFTSIIPYSMLQNTCIPRLLNPVRDHDSSQKQIDFLPELQDLLSNFDNNKLGIMFHRRFVNFPLQLLGPLHLNLEEDLAWARGSSPGDSSLAADDEDRIRFRALSHVLLFTRGILEMPVSAKASKAAAAASSSSSSSSTVSITNITGANGVMFESFEDEVYCQFSDLVLQLNNTTTSTIPSNIILAFIPLENFAKIKLEIDKLSNFGN